MAAPPRPQRGTAANDGSKDTPSRHTAGTNGTRPKQGALARREYGLLARTGTAVDPADAGDPGRAASHGAMGEQDGRKPEEGDETLQRALPARGTREAGDEGGGPPERLRALNEYGPKGGERGGGPPTQQRAPIARSERPGGDSQSRQRGNPPRGQDQEEEAPPPHPSSVRNPRAGRREGGAPQAGRTQHPHTAQGRRKGGTLPNISARSHHTACK